MIHDSIFYKLVTDEDSYTQLLCNFMRVSGEFRTRVLGLFLSQELASRVAPDHIRSQGVIQGCGRPDIVVKNEQACVLLEVKVDPKRGLTCYQEISAGD